MELLCGKSVHLWTKRKMDGFEAINVKLVSPSLKLQLNLSAVYGPAVVSLPLYFLNTYPFSSGWHYITCIELFSIYLYSGARFFN